MDVTGIEVTWRGVMPMDLSIPRSLRRSRVLRTTVLNTPTGATAPKHQSERRGDADHDDPEGDGVADRRDAAGYALIAPSATRRLIEEFAARPDPPRERPTVAGITEREREVLTLIGRGLPNTAIADELFIGTATVKTHVARLFTKLGGHDRAKLVIIAYETGLVSPTR